MKHIGLLSDTHGYLDPKFKELFESCDEIWHAGDIGDPEVARQLEAIKPFKAVYGNIDDRTIREKYPLHQRFDCEELDVWITHIGGYPGKYNPGIRQMIVENPPGLFICGHSHILKVMKDNKLGMIHINPGAAGRQGMHKVRTAVRFDIDKGKLKDLEVIELGSRGK